MKQIRALSFFAVFIFAASHLYAGPEVDNDAGTWTDDYTDNVGVAVESTNIVQDFGSGTIQLDPAQASGDLTTSDIKPTSFDKWEKVCIDGTWGDPGDFTVDIVGSSDASLPGLAGLTVDADGCVDISSLSNDTEKIRVRINFTDAPTVPVVIDDIQVTWNPVTEILLKKRAPETTVSGQDDIIYRIRYSVSYVEAENLVIWDTLPSGANVVIPAGEDYGQDDSPVLAESGHSPGWAFCDLPGPCTVSGTEVPGNSIYWDLGNVPAGTTRVLQWVAESPIGAINDTEYLNTAYADASNGEAAQNTNIVSTKVVSEPDPNIKKENHTLGSGQGVFNIFGTNTSYAGTTLEFVIFAENKRNETGSETMYNTVLYDDVSYLTDLIDATVGSSGFYDIQILNPNAENASNENYTTGTYIPNYTAPDGSKSNFPAIVWDLNTFVQDEELRVSFKVDLLPGLTNNTPTENHAYLASSNSTTVTDGMDIVIHTEIYPSPNWCKWTDNLVEKHGEFVQWGDMIRYRMGGKNRQPADLQKVVILDMVPPYTEFLNASFFSGGESGVIYYATITNYTDQLDPPPFSVTNAPADLDDPTPGTIWSTNQPPADDITWVAWYTPEVKVGDEFYVRLETIADTDQQNDCCEDAIAENWARLYINNYRYGDSPNVTVTNWNGSNWWSILDCDWPTPIKSETGLFGESDSVINPCTLPTPGVSTNTISVRNQGVDTFTNVMVTINWTQIPVNGVLTYPSFAGISGGSIVPGSFDPLKGTLQVELGPLAEDEEKEVQLVLSFPDGSEDSSTYQITSVLEGFDDCCPSLTNTMIEECRVTGTPDVKVRKNDVVNVIESGTEYDYSLTAQNVGGSPATGTYVVDRVPDKTVFVEAAGGAQLYVSAAMPPDLPSSVSVAQPLEATDIAANFTPATWDGTKWVSPFGSNTVWLAWLIEDADGTFKANASTTVTFRVRNDEAGPEANGGGGSINNTLLYNDEAIFSDQNLFALGNQVITTVLDNPGLDVLKSGPSVVAADEQFEWVVEFYNASANPDTVVSVTDILPTNVTFVSASMGWNDISTSFAIPSDPIYTLTTNATGQQELTFNVTSNSSTSAWVTNHLEELQGGFITIVVKSASTVVGGDILHNDVKGHAENENGQVNVDDEHEVLVNNADLSITKEVDNEIPTIGDTITYFIRLSNEGAHDAHNVELSDTLPDGLTYVAGSLLMLHPEYSLGEPVTNLTNGTTILNWNMTNVNTISNTTMGLGEIPGNSGDIYFTYRATVDSDVTEGSTLPNNIQVTTTTAEDPNYPNKDSEPVTIPPPDPAVTKSATETVLPGNTVTWEIDYRNLSPVAATNVYVMDTMPDTDGDGTTDVSFVSTSTEGPGTINVYYHPPTNPAPTFDPADPEAGGWTTNATGMIVNYIAYNIGELPGNAGPYTLKIYGAAVDPSTGLDLATGSKLTNFASVVTSGTDGNTTNSTATATSSVPSVEMTLSKEGDPEGAFPGALPGDDITYTISFKNNGSVTAYGLKINDVIPSQITLDSPPDTFSQITLTDGSGASINPLSTNGTEITDAISVTRDQNGNDITWYMGSTNSTDVTNYYRYVGIPVGATLSFEVTGKLNSDLANATFVNNSATLTVDNILDGDPAEEVTANNTDDSLVVVYLPDVSVGKVVTNITETTNTTFTEAGYTNEYTISINNEGDANAENVIIAEIIPEGTTYVPGSIEIPDGSSVEFNPSADTNATDFEVTIPILASPPNTDGEVSTNDFNTSGHSNTEYNVEAGGIGIQN